ncbi:MAG TPA: biopolymer transporter ExbD [Casimicrobiaceae bacterium]|nr:biopolymer transporter ExbD [Casimicrobiaceae bacterium]
MRRARKPINQINVVPYIDVMLVLLVIFMVTAPLIAPGEIQLPSVGSKLTPAVNALRINVKPDKSIELVDEASSNRRTVRASLDTLVAQVRDIQAGRDQAVVIVADGASRYQDVIGILDRLQQGGIKRVGLLARPTP